jgi:chromosome segregation ATPase
MIDFCEKQSDVVPEEIAVDSENNEKEEVQRLHAELEESNKLVADLNERLEEAARYKSSSESERAARQSELNDLRAQLRTKEIELNEKSETIAALKQKFSELNTEKEDKLQTAAMKKEAAIAKLRGK